MTCFFIIVAKCVNVKCNAHEMCLDGICRCKKGYRKSMAAKGKCVKGEVPFTKLGPDNGKNLWMPKTTQPVNKTDWFFLAGILDARARRRLEWKLKQNFFIVFFLFSSSNDGRQGWQYSKGLIYLGSIFWLTKLAFLMARALVSDNGIYLCLTHS